MRRHATLREAAHWAFSDDHAAHGPQPPHGAADVLSTLDDAALGEAMGRMAAIGRLSDDDIRSLRTRRRRASAATLTAALVAMIGIGTWQAGTLRPDAPIAQHIETRRGEQRTVQLADGSTVQLDGATSLDVTLADDGRRIELQRGEAYFDIAHDAQRPFVVLAGSSRTSVLGTAFSLDISHSAVKLAVYRGRVRFGPADADRNDVIVPAGWRSKFAGGAAAQPTRFDPSQQDWREAWVDTDDMTLADLVDALNRRGGPMIAPLSPNLASLPLSGRFKLDEPEQLLSALGDAYGFRVSHAGDRIDLIAAGEKRADSGVR